MAPTSWLDVPRDFPERGPFYADTATHPLGGHKSQGGQDVVVRAIFRAIGETNRQFVELGFNEPAQCVGSGSNTCRLWLDGWSGVLLDATFSNASIGLHQVMLSSDNVARVLSERGVSYGDCQCPPRARAGSCRPPVNSMPTVDACR